MHPSRYIIHRIPKASGGFRQIEEPDPQLKAEQRKLLPLLNRLPVSPHAHGFVRGRSVVTNAKAHAGRKYLAQFDLKDFFPSCKSHMIRRALLQAGLPPEEAARITYICTYGNRLPQGAPTSPALANICAYRLDMRLAGLARELDAIYTRYADDLTFSFTEAKHIYFIPHIVQYVVKDEGFRLNGKKTRITLPSAQLRVTGVVLDQHSDHVGVSREYRRRLRARIHQYALGKNNERYEVLAGCCSWVYSANHVQGKKLFDQLKGAQNASSAI